MPLDEQTIAPFIQVYLQWQNEFEEKGLPDDIKSRLNDIIEQFRAAAEETSSLDDFLVMVQEKGLNEKAAAVYSESFMAGNQAQMASEQADASGETGAAADTTAGGAAQVEKAFDMVIDAVKKDRESALGEEGREWEIPLYDRMIELYDSGISYPLYLKALEEEGIHDRMAQLQVRDMLVEGVESCKMMRDIPYLEMYQELLDTYDQLCSDAPSGYLNPVIWETTDYTIRMKHRPRQIEWNMRDLLFSRLLNLTHNWIDSYTRHAPNDPRWLVRGDLDETMRRIKLAKHTNAGRARATENLLKEYFDIKFEEMFEDPVFLHMRESRDKITFVFLPYTDARLEFLREEVWPQMKPIDPPPGELIARAEQEYDTKHYQEISSSEEMDAEFKMMLEKMSDEERERYYHLHKNKKLHGAGDGGKLSPNLKDNISPSMRKEMNM